MMIRKLLWITWLLALSVTLYAQKTFELKTGDILFQTNKAQTSFVKAIENVTTSADDLNFSHVGVVVIEEGEIFVLEATMPVVCKTPLEKYLKQAKLVNGKPLVVVGRLKPRFRKSIPKAIEIMKSLLGKPYDYVFLPDNDDYYCSEIIYLAFLRRNGKPIFKASPMSFKDKRTGETSPLWVKHFERYKTPIPEGVPGTSPGEMSRSKAIKLVHHFF